MGAVLTVLVDNVVLLAVRYYRYTMLCDRYTEEEAGTRGARAGKGGRGGRGGVPYLRIDAGDRGVKDIGRGFKETTPRRAFVFDAKAFFACGGDIHRLFSSQYFIVGRREGGYWIPVFMLRSNTFGKTLMYILLARHCPGGRRGCAMDESGADPEAWADDLLGCRERFLFSPFRAAPMFRGQ